MITAEILQHFCAHADSSPPHLAQPWLETWRAGEWSWASCGRILVGVPGRVRWVEPATPRLPRLAGVERDLTAAELANKFSEFPPLPRPCFAAEDYDDGRTDSAAIPQRVEILGRDFSDVFLRRLRDCLPGAEFAVLGPDHRKDITPLGGRCAGGGLWLLMPIRRFTPDGRRLT